MHWQLGESEMAHRAGAVLFTMAPSGSINPTNVPSSSSAPGMERFHSEYKPLEPTSGTYGAGDDPRRASEEAEVRERGSRRRRQSPASAQPMQTQQLAPIGLGLKRGHWMVLPSLTELTEGVPAFGGARNHRREVKEE